IEGIVEDREYPVLQRCTEIDEHVAAAHQIELGERWIGHQVVANEHAALADVAVDPVAAFLAAKEPGEPLLADLGGDRLWIQPLTLGFHRALAQAAAPPLAR